MNHPVLNSTYPISIAIHPLTSSFSMRHLQLLFLLSLLPFSICHESRGFRDCSEPLKFHCGSRSLKISYPFYTGVRPQYCGFPGHCITCDGNKTTLQLDSGTYLVNEINYTHGFLTLAETKSIEGGSCPVGVGNTSFNNIPLFDLKEDNEALSLVRCRDPPPLRDEKLHELDCTSNESGWRWYYRPFRVDGSLPSSCGRPVKIWLRRAAVELLEGGRASFWDALSWGFDVVWKAGKEWCGHCQRSGGVCGYNSSQKSSKTCFCPDGTSETSCGSESTAPIPPRDPAAPKGSGGLNVQQKVIIATASSVAGFLGAMAAVCVWLKRRRGKALSPSRNFLFRSTSGVPSSFVKDPESLSGSYFYTPIFTYEELEVATDGFDSSKELGDGGFGVVYKGVLKDGRVVAVKRLHERNYRRVQQFRNEVEILNRIRHPNLVSLYGCTNRDSRELLLVYEYIPNGTLADHLHGSHASKCLLTWPIRLSIAAETAAALAYLHATEPQIIHRDVKTSNILLDNGFHVKVADFGLSRAFPSPLTTHVSTAPQGTPGYVDPEYHQCYQLTDKSDVYSFGVVLVELISSKPAVDMDRPRSEINLSNMAMAKIPRGLIRELVDATLPFDTDPEVRRTIEAVAELAFRCLQPEKDMRPSMDEVRDTLENLHGGDRRMLSPGGVTDGTCSLLKSAGAPLSPNTVVGNWPSMSTTSTTVSS